MASLVVSRHLFHCGSRLIYYLFDSFPIKFVIWIVKSEPIIINKKKNKQSISNHKVVLRRCVSSKSKSELNLNDKSIAMAGNRYNIKVERIKQEQKLQEYCNDNDINDACNVTGEVSIANPGYTFNKENHLPFWQPPNNECVNCIFWRLGFLQLRGQQLIV